MRPSARSVSQRLGRPQPRILIRPRNDSRPNRLRWPARSLPIPTHFWMKATTTTGRWFSTWRIGDSPFAKLAPPPPRVRLPNRATTSSGEQGGWEIKTFPQSGAVLIAPAGSGSGKVRETFWHFESFRPSDGHCGTSFVSRRLNGFLSAVESRLDLVHLPIATHVRTFYERGPTTQRNRAKFVAR